MQRRRRRRRKNQTRRSVSFITFYSFFLLLLSIIFFSLPHNFFDFFLLNFFFLSIFSTFYRVLFLISRDNFHTQINFFFPSFLYQAKLRNIYANHKNYFITFAQNIPLFSPSIYFL